MKFGVPRGVPTRQVTVTLLLVLGLTVALAYAVRLSYYGALNITNSFGYQTSVVAAQRDEEVLLTEQFDSKFTKIELEPHEALLSQDLQRIDGLAESEAERAPRFKFPATRQSYETLETDLENREAAGKMRFAATVEANAHSRDISNALFAFVALLFVVVVGRLRQTVEEGRSIVERLQEAFISRRRDIPNVDVGNVLISSTRGSNVGGDIYDAFTLDDRRAMFLVADVSGKGVDAAVDTALIKYTIRTLFSMESDPSIILSNFSSIYLSSKETSESFVVVFFAVLDLQTGALSYASAGHEPAWSILSKRISSLAPCGPIVSSELESVYSTCELRLSPGDAFVIATDGLTESRDAQGSLLGADGVAAWLADIGGSAQGMADAIVRRLRARSPQLTDDLAVLVVRYTPS